VSPESTDFLYPFIEGDERDATSLLRDLSASARAKAGESTILVHAMRERWAATLGGAAAAMAGRVAAGGRVLVFGNGGSATDASTLAALLSTPPRGRPVAARSLVADESVVTALGNDVGFDLVFSRQLIAHGRPDDVAIGVSTSGDSENVLRGFVEAKRLGLLTIGFAGYDGGRMATSGAVDHCVVVGSDSVHRVQEAQAALGFDLWERLQRQLGEPAA